MPDRNPKYNFGMVCVYLIFVSLQPVCAVEDSLRNHYPFSPYSFSREWEKDFYVIYDPGRHVYLLYTSRIPARYQVPLLLTPPEYYAYHSRLLRQHYFRWKNSAPFAETLAKDIYSPYSFVKKRKRRPPLGSGGFRYQLRGDVELSVGIKQNSSQNPLLPVRNRKRTWFDFNEKIRMGFQAEVGTKFRMDMSYHTESLYDEDSRKIKMSYTGEEDEFIRLIEAGQVGLSTYNSLIRGESELFGLKADFQFGKFFLNTVLAQQETEMRKVNTINITNKREFEIPVSRYEQNQHFFLSHYFYELYDEALAGLPYVASSVIINRVEVWVTNKTRQFENTRNIVALTDLGEPRVISHPQVIPDLSEGKALPFNRVNNLYEVLLTDYPGTRKIEQVNQSLHGFLESGVHFEKVESARLLQSSEYVFHEQLGYISLLQPLASDEVLGVAFEFSYKGGIYQVGEFSTDQMNAVSECLFVKLLKGAALSPGMACWKLMMKNVYSLPVSSFKKEDFKMDILFLYDPAGMYVSHVPEGKKENESFLSLLGVDKLDSRLNSRPDGLFDLIEGYTVLPERGKIIFPSVEPFGRTLSNAIGEEEVAAHYIFPELYDSTFTYVAQLTEKKKFILKGEYTGEGFMQEDAPWKNSLPSGMQRKTVAGMELTYQFSKELLAGITVMHLSERAPDTKILPGQEALKNTLWGTHVNYRTENHTLTEWLKKSSYFKFSQPFVFSWNSEFAYLKAGHVSNKEYGEYAWLDDFESVKGSYSLSDPAAWQISSTPWQDVQPLFPEASLVNDVSYGKNRALLAWYIIDPLLTGKSSATPGHLRNDKEQLSNHAVREVSYRELFPAREYAYAETTRLPVLNIAFYPEERGPYNLDTEGMSTDGKLLNPTQRWGGMMRKIEWTDFDAANIQYIEFWLMDPFISNREVQSGGDLYLNLGEVSEDILKDGKKFFENGLPVDGDPSRVETTVWGKVPEQQNTVYAFENSSDARKRQDVGLNGLSSEEEKSFPVYKEYLEKILRTVSSETLQRWQEDIFSPIHDPAGDNFHHFRGTDYDRAETDILTRYKRYNGTEGNSCLMKDSPERYDISAKYTPDTEDLNQDNTMNEYEKYYEYRISLRPEDLKSGVNYITGSRTATVQLENGSKEEVTWYQFKIPIRQFTRRVGNIPDFTSIRFIRLYLTGFSEPVVLRMASFGLVRGEWRVYEQALEETVLPASDKTVVEVSVVSLEEDNTRKPVNYVLPPGVERVTNPDQSQLIRKNEQSLSIRIKELGGGESRAVCREVSHNLRHYERLQLFVHAEAFPDDQTLLADDELCLFLRIGGDYRNNYYEYEVPLILTPAGLYNPAIRSDREMVWPLLNQVDIPLSLFTELKLKRNRLIQDKVDGIDLRTVFTEMDPANSRNRVLIRGNPSLSDVTIVMIGVRNRCDMRKQVEVWVNELRLSGYEDKGGWALKNRVHLQVSDLGMFSAGSHFESVGFGGLQQTRLERRMEDYQHYSFAASLQLEKLFPSSVRLRIPFSYSWTKEKSVPLYNPFNRDILLTRALHELETGQEKDSLCWLVKDQTITKSFSLNGVQVGIRSKSPMPYDPANFTFTYMYGETSHRDPETTYENSRTHTAIMDYLYEPVPRSVAVFKQPELFYLPAHLSFSTTIRRYYYEKEKRQPESLAGNAIQPLSFIQDFSWKRSFVLRWNLTRHLQVSFQSGTTARIEEPHMQVNKKLNPDGYQVWKDSVRHSLLHFGRPLLYSQNFMANYTLPFSLLPVMNWVQGTVGYQAVYNWEKVGNERNSSRVGNHLKNQRTLKSQSGINFISLYNKNPYLKEVNRMFQPGTSENREGKRVVDYMSRFVMMIRRINVSYERIDGMTLPGFYPEAGDLLGQKRYQGKWAPGLKFAFGGVKSDYVERFLSRGWLIIQENSLSPAVINNSGKWSFQCFLEPFTGFRIELMADRLHTRTSRIEYMLPGMPVRKGGSLTMNVVAAGSALKKAGRATNQFESSSFHTFLDNCVVIANRMEEHFIPLTYPDNGFLSGSSYAGQPYQKGSVRKESPEVLIPAFLSAYRGRNPRKISFSPVLPFSSLFPNWKLTVDGLGRISPFKKYFRVIQLTHQYRGVYHFSYHSRLNWVEGTGDYGFTPASEAVPVPLPAFLFQISSVTLTDGFTPLVGVDATLLNNMTVGFHYHRVRNLNLSITSLQLNESRTSEYIAGLGYRMMELNRYFPRFRKSRDARELHVRIDFSYRKNISLIRKIEDRITQLTAGYDTTAFHFLAEYGLNRDVTLKFFFDLQKETPLLSETTWPVTTTQGGISLLLSLNRNK